MARKKEDHNKDEKEINPAIIAILAPIFAIIGLVVGFLVCYLTFVRYGGN